MELWYPGARHTYTPNPRGSYVSGFPYRGVLHTTEGFSVAGAIGAYKASGSFPHFTVTNGFVEQHVPINTFATALERRPGTIDTNRASAIQIEIVWFAGKADQMSDGLLDTLAPLMRWIERQTGIRFESHAQFGNVVKRFTNDQWQKFDSWCGHAHVPNNNHWDPGAFPIDKLHPLFDPQPPEEENMEKPTDIVHEYVWPSGRSLVRLLRNGDVRCYGLTFRGAINQIPLNDRKNWSEGEGVVFPLDVNNPEAGYEVRDWDDNMIAQFTPQWAKEHGI